MKIIVGLAIFFLSSLAHGANKVDPLLRIIAEQPQVGYALSQKALLVDARGRKLIDCFIKTLKPQEVSQNLEKIGGRARSIIGDIMTADVPLDAIEEVATWEDVEYIEAPKPMNLKMDVARGFTKVDTVQEGGGGLSKSFTGSGVIVGSVDVALDWDEADFKKSDGTTRILALWDQTKGTGGVSEIAGSTGVECNSEGIQKGTCSATKDGSGDSISHGTHVMGVAASSNATYKGVAPDADIMFVFNGASDADSGGSLSTKVIDAVNYIFKKAASKGKAAVVNMSLGTSLGAHDDTSSFEKGLNNLVSGKKGRAIVNAAGNERFNSQDSGAATFNGIHASLSVSSGSAKAWEFAVRESGSMSNFISVFSRQVIVDIWLGKSDSCTIEVDAFKDSTDGLTAKASRTIDMSAVSAGGTSSDQKDGTVTLNLNFSEKENANNGKQHAVATITFESGVGASTIRSYSFDVIFRGSCTGDAWLYPDQTSIVSFYKRSDGTSRSGYTYVAGDSKSTTTIPATSSKVIAVGSFMGREGWTDAAGTAHKQTAKPSDPDGSLGATGGTVGDISLFSSLGPTADGRKKPDISAPGEPILSTLSTSGKSSISSGRIVDSTKTHFKLEGTSMAAPHVAGTIALLFQKNNCATNEDVTSAIKNNAALNSFTGTSPDANTWGAGTLDALAAIKAIVEQPSDCTSEVIQQQGQTDSSTSKGGCASQIVAGGSAGALTFSFLLLLPLWIWRRGSGRSRS